MNRVTQSSVLATARAYTSAGLSVIPVRTDTSKKPCIAWKKFQRRAPSASELTDLFARDCGIAVVTGSVSGNLEVLDFEDTAPWDAACQLLSEKAPELLSGLPIVQTPSGGRHVYYRCTLVEPNQLLAATPRAGKNEVLIETRGHGGYVIAPGSPAACHKAGEPYAVIQGSLTDLPVITEQQRNLLIETARSFDQRSGPATDSDTGGLDDGGILGVVHESPPLLDCKQVVAECISIQTIQYRTFGKRLVFKFKVLSPKRYTDVHLDMFVRQVSPTSKLWVSTNLFKAARVACGSLKPRQEIKKKMFIGGTFRSELRKVGKAGAAYTVIACLLERMD